MKQFRYFAFALLLGAFFSLSAYAQKGSSNGDPTHGGKPNHFGLSDSCWKVFLAGLSSGDAAKLTVDQQTITANQTQIDTLQSQIIALLRSGGKGSRPDSATLVKLKALEVQIQALNQANGAAQLEIATIIKSNNSLLATVEENCGRSPRDTGKGKGGGRDTSKGGGPGKIGNPRGHFGLSDSCWNIFLSQISTADAASLAADQKTIEGNEAQIDTLQRKIHDLLKNGGGKDSTVRNEVRALLAQIQTLRKASLDAAKDYAAIIKKNESILQSIRQDCGRVKHKGSAGDPGNGLTVTDIVPNPASVGGSISMTIGLTSDAEVTIFASLIGPQGPPAMLIFNGKLTAGTTPETIALGRLGAGAYMITIQSGNTSIQKKLVIQ